MPGELTRRARRAYARLYLWAADRLYNEFAPLYDAVSWLVSSGQWARWRRVALDYVQGDRRAGGGLRHGRTAHGDGGARVARHRRGPIGGDAAGDEHKKRGSSGTAPARRIRGRVQALPLRDACCDTVVSTFPAPYIVEAASLSEIARVLRPGGRLVVVGLAIYAERRKPEMPFYLATPPEPGVDTFCSRAEDAGFRVRRSSRFMPPARLPVLLAERPA